MCLCPWLKLKTRKTQMAPTGENGCVQEDKGLGWGKSLPVPSVQEIVRNDPQCVPERFIQEKKDRPLDSELYIPADSSEIPIINFSLLANGDADELKKLDSACKDWGFFQVCVCIQSNELFLIYTLLNETYLTHNVIFAASKSWDIRKGVARYEGSSSSIF